MRSRPIAQLYAEAIRNLLLVAIGGLLAVGSLGLVLHTQLSNRSAMLARALEGAVRGDAGPPPPQDEFAGAIEVARQVGRELNEVRGERMQLERRMEAVMKALDAGVVVLEPDLHVTSANDRAAELLGCADAAEVAARWRAGVAAQLGDLRSRFNGSGPAMGEIALALPPDGRRLSVELYALGDRASAGYVALLKSADSLAALQAELGLAIQMRGLMRFYAAFAHDLKAPLNAMVMTLELLKMSVQSAGNDEAVQAKQTKYLTVLNEEIHRLDRQLRMLLSHTAPPSDVQEPVDLRTVLQEIEGLLAPQARRQRVTLVSTVPDTAVMVVGQKDRLKQALLNILINALEAMSEGGALTTHLEPQDGMASLTIHDDGPGIPPETLQSIYDMHFTTKSGGTGVGLYVARSVVRSHGGSIDVQSAPGTGTTFVLRLPTVGADQPARPQAL
jgi:signal transduction histidine kinase